MRDLDSIHFILSRIVRAPLKNLFLHFVAFFVK